MTCFRLWLGQVILVLEAFAPDGNHWLPWAVTTTAVCTLLTFGIVSAAYYQMFATMVVSDDTTTIIDLNHSYYPCDTARRCVPAGICGGVGALHSSRNHRLFGTAPRPATPAPGDNAGVAQQCVVCVRARCSLALIPNTRARRVCVCVRTRARACMHVCNVCRSGGQGATRFTTSRWSKWAFLSFLAACRRGFCCCRFCAVPTNSYLTRQCKTPLR